MKVLYLITGLGGGGAEKVVVDLADQMLKRGHQVKIAYLKGEVIVSPQNKEIDLVYLGFESIKNIKHAYYNYKKLLESFQPDVVHAHMVHANIFSRISRKFFPVIKLICTAHSNHEGGKLRMLAYKLTNHLADLTTNVSQSAVKSFELLGAVPQGQMRVIYNGIDLTRFKYYEQAKNTLFEELNIEIERSLVLAVGRFHEAKDYPNLLQAFKLLVDNSSVKKLPYLAIAGEGELRPIIENLIEELQLSHHVKLLGRRDDIPKLMSAADIFVLSSKFEGFGLVVAEAMACECFVVATDCGGVREVMGEYGTLVSPENSDELVDALITVLNKNKEDIIINNKKALDYVESTYALDKIVNQWVEIYEK